jgi:protein-tyrosine phosphatase
VRIATVCSHNRTRSVMTAAMLQSMLDRRLGPGRAELESFGFGPEGIPSIPDAVDAMRRRGLDTSGHRSRKVTKERIEPADLVLTSERDHVIKIAAQSPAAYRQTMTLPEFLSLAEWSMPDERQPLRAWVADLTSERTAREYLSGHVEEIVDPTGTSPRVFEAAVVEMEAQCARVVELLARVLDPAD